MLETAEKGTEVTKATWEIRAEANPEKPYNGQTPEEMWETAQVLVDEIYEQNPHAVFTKMITLHLLKNIRGYCMERSNDMFEAGERSAMAWAVDVGLTNQSITALTSLDISCTGDDFLYNEAKGVDNTKN